MDRKLVSIEARNDITKVAVQSGADSLNLVKCCSTVYPLHDQEQYMNGDGHIVTYGGITYKVGEDLYGIFSYENNMTPLELQICIYTLLGSLVDNGDIVEATLSCPVFIYTDSVICELYKKHVFNDGRWIEITIDGVHRVFRFDLERSIVCPVWFGLLYQNSNRYGENTVGIIDIGERDTNYMIYQKLKLLENYSFTDCMRWNLFDYLSMKDDDTNKCKQDWIDSILAKCVEHGWNIKLTALIFTGGTSYYLKPEIEKVKAEKKLNIDLDLITEESDFLNAKGFLKRLMLQNGSK